jgi:type I restriction enzyme M protein
VATAAINPHIVVPTYYDERFDRAFDAAMAKEAFSDFSPLSLAALQDQGLLETRGGHGSPSTSQRVGTVPYIKVSDLRAGFVNINPTNRVPRTVAEGFWRGAESGLRAFDLICPERTSKNIGDFCVLMPGQEQLVLTKEMIILRPGPKATFDPFYLVWAMTLGIVRDQWRRVTFMQTNREDVGSRYLEIRVPVPHSRAAGVAASKAFRDYYRDVGKARGALADYLATSGSHHFFVSGAE